MLVLYQRNHLITKLILILEEDYIDIKLKQGKRIFKNIKYPNIPLDINDLYVITSDRDRLDLLANQFYNNVDYWWIIANANPGIIKSIAAKAMVAPDITS